MARILPLDTTENPRWLAYEKQNFIDPRPVLLITNNKEPSRKLKKKKRSVWIWSDGMVAKHPKQQTSAFILHHLSVGLIVNI